MLNEKYSNRIENLVGKDCKITGNLTGKGLLQIDGRIKGDIIWEDDIIFDTTSSCIGNISCKNAFVNGEILGNILCENNLTIENNGKIHGDITTKYLIINEGGCFNGNCNTLPDEDPDVTS
ncbi:polymer-forming cytoskeletal protein [Clostridium aestuarii]|uniref:Polymer-forming cytoskeletal protein n=1 Tax=Clostridium aestuarii TaxID=338193 RepID=A0ABT4D2P5_9CLOT|nr:polymer-forming cytoskeletal protein [Clostridium aestuarii]MCY6484450.1 polymer-forming cytoskeletal protein [Clostridium aestuarii]